MSKKQSIKPPKDLYRVIVEPGGGGMYPKFEKFWKIQKFDQGFSDLTGEVCYKTISDGLSITNFFMWRAIRKELKRLNAGYQTEIYSINEERIK